ncbi:UDP-2,3-diacylglucosamine hydrolase [Chitiniphilus shinanonensis]|uniref:UDP-2,3-diacylglucosamine hydrolase n=1 Tax=Chitiniphilus shinanonensis TaxID=553088 RepID=A0ABQ6BVD6_9NEIS|nr:UDP-2,3-diacylglucosamine diphosphatase [Chitiniphilus shinanonensis]GLS05311.1 UDP-2,3-diacylglucosamine hydrolase [Chitiniphilus shinanonensis]
MSRPVLLISDLHLSPADPATVAAFEVFVAGPARQAQALYLLGDLFEVWIGDDQLDDPFYARIARQLAGLAASGVAVHFMAGNRDFLCGTRFARAAGLTLLPDPTVIAPFGAPLLLMHGDSLCTDDAAYQRFRRIVRNPLVQWLWRRLPYSWRNREAAQIRARSSASNRDKAAYIMDVNVGAVAQAMRQAGARVLIHGHTHRPARHAEAEGTRWVLPDWHAGHGGYLQVTAAGQTLCTLAHHPWPGIAAA